MAVVLPALRRQCRGVLPLALCGGRFQRDRHRQPRFSRMMADECPGVARQCRELIRKNPIALSVAPVGFAMSLSLALRESTVMIAPIVQFVKYVRLCSSSLCSAWFSAPSTVNGNQTDGASDKRGDRGVDGGHSPPARRSEIGRLFRSPAPPRRGRWARRGGWLPPRPSRPPCAPRASARSSASRHRRRRRLPPYQPPLMRSGWKRRPHRCEPRGKASEIVPGKVITPLVSRWLLLFVYERLRRASYKMPEQRWAAIAPGVGLDAKCRVTPSEICL